jgi:hypothetical protein
MAPMPSLNPFGVNRRVGTCCPSGKVMSISAKLPRASAIGAVQNAETFTGEGNSLRQKFALPTLPVRNDSPRIQLVPRKHRLSKDHASEKVPKYPIRLSAKSTSLFK